MSSPRKMAIEANRANEQLAGKPKKRKTFGPKPKTPKPQNAPNPTIGLTHSHVKR
jgi:hypothetical protein